MKYNPYIKTMQNPMRDDSDPVAFIPALYPDVAFIHVQVADKYGNACIYGPVVNDIALAAATRKVIITAEEIVPEINLRYVKDGARIPFIYSDAVVELPFGAVPGNMPGYYYWSRQWWEKVMRYGGPDEERFMEFFDEWVMGTKDQFEFVEKLGGQSGLPKRVARQRPRKVKTKILISGIRSTLPIIKRIFITER